ncbi:hypothetical protein BDF14DRAFT_1883227 [Spinellus fusiger]|nr:hypothetical protein BDF14DRAFT_1883227 [Spinellus fusiger]
MSSDKPTLETSLPTRMSSKQSNYLRMQTQLEELEKTVKVLRKNLQETSEQVPALRKLWIIQSSIIMSTSKVLAKTDAMEKQTPSETNDRE